MTAAARILVTEDHAEVRELVASTLRIAGHDVRIAEDGTAAMALCQHWRPHLVVLDLDLPDADGLDVLERIRSRAPATAVIILTGRRTEAQRVSGLRQGADDYVVKPFSARELAARVEAVLRRSAHPDDGDDRIAIDPAARLVRIDGQPLELTRLEFDLLAFLLGNPGRVLSREELLREVWASSPEWQVERTVTEHVRRLRLKLGDLGSSIVNVRGIGYRYDPPER